MDTDSFKVQVNMAEVTGIALLTSTATIPHMHMSQKPLGCSRRKGPIEKRFHKTKATFH